MPNKLKFRVTSKIAPIVSIDTTADAVYVYFQRGVKVAKTKVVNEWPLVAVDFDEKGDVIGIEAISCGDMSLKRVAESASVRVPKKLVEEAQYKPARELAIA